MGFFLAIPALSSSQLAFKGRLKLQCTANSSLKCGGSQLFRSPAAGGGLVLRGTGVEEQQPVRQQEKEPVACKVEATAGSFTTCKDIKSI